MRDSNGFLFAGSKPFIIVLFILVGLVSLGNSGGRVTTSNAGTTGAPKPRARERGGRMKSEPHPTRGKRTKAPNKTFNRERGQAVSAPEKKRIQEPRTFHPRCISERRLSPAAWALAAFEI